MVQDALRHAMESGVAFRRGLPCNILGLPGEFRDNADVATSLGGVTSLVKAHAGELIGRHAESLQVTTSVQTYFKDFKASRLPPHDYCRDSTMQGPMPNLKSKVALGWPDLTYLFEGRNEEDQEYTTHCATPGTHTWLAQLVDLITRVSLSRVALSGCPCQVALSGCPYQSVLVRDGLIRVSLSGWPYQGVLVRVALSGCPCQGGLIRVSYQGVLVRMSLHQGVLVRLALSGCPCQGGLIRASLSGWPYQGVLVRVALSGCPYQGVLVRGGLIRVSLSGCAYIRVALSGCPCQGGLVRKRLSVRLALDTPDPKRQRFDHKRSYSGQATPSSYVRPCNSILYRTLVLTMPKRPRSQAGGSDGFVYLMRCRSDSGVVYFKIGHSADPDKRLRTLQTGNPFRIKLYNIIAVEQMSDAETTAHQAVAHLMDRTEGGGTEWFTRKRQINTTREEIWETILKGLRDNGLLSSSSSSSTSSISD
eukprot:Em0003g1485a